LDKIIHEENFNAEETKYFLSQIEKPVINVSEVVDLVGHCSNPFK